MWGLEDKVVIVTGGAAGMGEATVGRFAAEGARVVIADVQRAKGEALASQKPEQLSFVEHDVSDQDSWCKLVDGVSAKFGQLDVLVNNAGILRTGPVDTMPIEEFDALIAVNLRGVFLGIQAVTPLMSASGGGAIINTSSRAGLVALPQLAAYSASKWAVRGLTKAAAVELGPRGIRVNSIHPGPVDTPMTEGFGFVRGEGKAPNLPLRRYGVPEDIASLHLFLASPHSSWITGAEIAIDGGEAAGPSHRRE
jgi:3alpha(or 20beta)-hydroxysteroid dehydrogenase